MSQLGLRIAGILCACSMMLSVAFGQTYNVLMSFSGPDGNGPLGTLVQGVDGKLYGTTIAGGPNNLGSAFKMTMGGQFTLLNGFCKTTSCVATNPEAGLVQGIDGYFYGTTTGTVCTNTDYNCATVFKMSAAGNLVVLDAFTGIGNLPGPYTLVQSADSTLYGMTFGSVYKTTTRGTLTTLVNFAGSGSGLTESPQGDFYISLYEAGAKLNGAIQDMTPEGSVSTIHDFCSEPSCQDGAYPDASVVVGNDGNLYGTTTEGGANGGGTVFKLTPTGKLTTLYNFCFGTNCVDGMYPRGLVLGSDGKFYGVTFYGGQSSSGSPSGNGVLYQITSTGIFKRLYSFCSQSGCSDGAGPFGSLVQATNGKFYGSTEYGGTSSSCAGGCGTIFSLSVGLGPFVALPINTAPAGTTVGILGQGLSGTTSVTFNGTPAGYTIKGDTYLTATVPSGATSGRVKVTTSSGTLTSNRIFYVQP